MSENKSVEDKTIVNNGDEAVVAQDGVEAEDVANQQIGENVRPGGATVYENREYTEAEANSMNVMMARRTGGDVHEDDEDDESEEDEDEEAEQ